MRDKSFSRCKMKENNKESILGFDVCNTNKEKLLSDVMTDFQENKKSIIININPEIVTQNYKNKELKELFNKQKYQIPDGIGIVYASKMKKGNIKKRITGIDFMLDICRESPPCDAKIFLYGSKPEIAEKAKHELEKQYPDINIVGTCDGYTEEEIVIKKIKDSNANILFVGLGSPKQEEFIFRNKYKLSNIKIFMPVGGSFDVISDTLKRAPKWMIKANLEWLYRLLKQPQRIFRQLSIVKFIILVLLKNDYKEL